MSRSPNGFSRKLGIALALCLLLPSLEATAADSCALEFAKIITTDKPTSVFVQDHFIQSTLGVDRASFVFFGQRSLSPKDHDRAVRSLSASGGLSLENIQKVHKDLAGGKARLGFRTSSEAKVIGTQSFKGHVALSRAEREAVDANPFLSFIEVTGYKKVGPEELDLAVGDVVFPNVENHQKFRAYLSEATLQSIARSKAKPGDDSAINAEIVEDLLAFSLKDAEKSLAVGGEPPERILTLLEWRVKSLGLYYEPPFSQKGRHLVSDYSHINANRSNEVAEAIVDAFAEKHRLASDMRRGFRPQLTDSQEAWATYMRRTIEGRGVQDLSKFAANLKRLASDLSPEERGIFEDYYLTRILAGIRMADATPESLLGDFRRFKKTHYSSSIPEKSRALMIPIDFIRTFAERPADLARHLEDHYHLDSTLFRGVSNPRAMKERDYLDYFKSYKGRQASEMGRTIFDEREAYTKLSMLRYNADLVEGRLVHEALQHANKHAAWGAPNSAKTYLVSTTDFNTVAFRFAADKGYVKGTSANENGTAHFVLESFRPKGGAVDFNEFRLTDPNWRNYYPRQREISIAGGIDPNSVKRIYVLKPYAPGEKVPRVGPEKHAKIVQILERDEKTPELVWILEKQDNAWVRVGTPKQIFN